MMHYLYSAEGLSYFLTEVRLSGSIPPLKEIREEKDGKLRLTAR